nr:MATE family efflux transporter [uncultured Agathobacter sp.]
MKDLTKGKPSRLILAFAIPIFMANILQLTYSIVDTRIVGSYLGENSLAAVGATTTLSNLMIGFLMGLANGFAIITAQKFGARDYAGVKKSFALSIKMGCIIALAITVLCLLFLRQILGFLNVSNDLMGMAVSYIFIIIAGLVATFLYDACAAALRALGDTVTPLVILAVSVCLNMAGDIFFVVVLKAGVAGAAIATVLAQVIAFIVCYVYMVKRYELLRLSRSDLFDSHLLRRSMKLCGENCDIVMKMTMLKAGLSMAFMSSLVNIGSLTLQTAINRLGQDIIVAHTAARKISEIFMVMFTVFGQTMATFCGQNIGAGEVARVKKGIKLAIFYTCIWCTMAIIASYTIGPWLVKLVTGTNNPIVIKNATNYLKFDTLFYYVTAVICIVRNAMQGLGEQITPLVSSSLEMVGKIVIAFTLVPLLGYTGVIVAEPIVWFIMVIPLLVKIYNMPVLRKQGHGI